MLSKMLAPVKSTNKILKISFLDRSQWTESAPKKLKNSIQWLPHKMPPGHPTKKKNKLHWSQESRTLCHWPTQVHFWVYSTRTTCCSGCWWWWWWCWAWAVKKQKQHHQLLQRAMMSTEAVLNTSCIRSSGGLLSLTLVNSPKKLGTNKTSWEFSEKTIFGLSGSNLTSIFSRKFTFLSYGAQHLVTT